MTPNCQVPDHVVNHGGPNHKNQQIIEKEDTIRSLGNRKIATFVQDNTWCADAAIKAAPLLICTLDSTIPA